MFKLTLFISFFVININAFAGTHGGGTCSVPEGGGGGGGGVLTSADPSLSSTGGGGLGLVASKEIIYSISKTATTSNFAHAQLINGQWQVQQVVIPTQDLTATELSALELSKQSKNWVELK